MAKEWSWSFSKKKSYDSCPKRYYEVDIQKNFVDDTTQLVWGNEVHKALAQAILHAHGMKATGTGRDRIEPAPLPETMAQYQYWIDTIGNTKGTVKVEEKYALTRDFQKVGYFDHNVWYRGICDMLMFKRDGKTATALDWKTGKMKHDSTQLMLMATCIFIHYPEVERVNTRFVWLQDGCTSRDVWEKGTIMNEWAPLIPELQGMEKAATTLTYPPRPGGLCKRYCPVTSCVFHGKGQNG